MSYTTLDSAVQELTAWTANDQPYLLWLAPRLVARHNDMRSHCEVPRYTVVSRKHENGFYTDK